MLPLGRQSLVERSCKIDATLLVLFVDFARYSLLFKVLDGFVHCFGFYNCDAENPAKSAIPFLNHNSWHWGRSFRGTRGAKLTSVVRAGWNGLDTNILAFVASVLGEAQCGRVAGRVGDGTRL